MIQPYIRVVCFFFSADKYCKLVRDEGGIKLLQGLRENTQTSPRVRQLAQLTLDKCRDHPESDLEDAAAI